MSDPLDDFPMPYTIQFAYPEGTPGARSLFIPDVTQRNATAGDAQIGHRLGVGTYTLQWSFNGPEALRMDVRMSDGGWIFRETMPAGNPSRSETRSLQWTVPTGTHTFRFYPPYGFSEESRTSGFGASLTVIPMANFSG